MGGFTSVIWFLLAVLITPYEEFKFQNSLASRIYPTSPQPDEGEPEVGSREEARIALEGTVIERGKFYYLYREYMSTWLLSILCCCLIKKESLWWKRRKFRYTRYETAVTRLNEEIDILKHPQTQRLSEFISKLILRKHQRALVQSFKKY